MTDDVVQFWCMSRKFEVGPGRRVLVINAYRLNPAGLAPLLSNDGERFYSVRCKYELQYNNLIYSQLMDTIRIC